MKINCDDKNQKDFDELKEKKVEHSSLSTPID